MPRSIVDDEQAYVEWLATHPNGYVVNAWRKPTPDSRADLESWARSIGGELSECPGCKPG